MKKKILCVAVIITTMMSSSVFASGINVFLNGNMLKTTESPMLENGTVMVPFRDIFEAVGMDVSWDASTKTVTGKKSDTNVVLSIGSNKGYVNGSEKALPLSPKIINGKTMVPLRFVAEAAGYPVKWDGENSRVIIGEGNIAGDITLSSGGKVVNAASLYTVDGTGTYAGYKKLMGHPYENVADLYFKTSTSGSVSSSDTIVVPKFFDGDKYIKWTYNGKKYAGKRKDIYDFLDLASSVHVDKEYKSTFGSIYNDWFNLRLLQLDSYRIVEGYTNYISGKTPYMRYTEPTYVSEKPTTKEKAPDIDGVVEHTNRSDSSTNVDDKSDGKSAYDDEFFNEWISESQLKNKYGWGVSWVGNKIILTDRDNKIVTINNAPESSFKDGKIYSDGSIKFQYVRDFTANGQTVHPNSIYFEISGLKEKGILSE